MKITAIHRAECPSCGVLAEHTGTTDDAAQAFVADGWEADTGRCPACAGPIVVTSPDGTNAAAKRMRAVAGLTMRELAALIGYGDKCNVGHIEAGRRNLTMEVAFRWANACGFDAALTFTPRSKP